MHNVRKILTVAVVTAAATAPAASAHTTPANPAATAPAQHAGNQQGTIAHGAGDGEQQSSMFGGGASLLLSWLGCTGVSSEEHGGVAADAGDTGTTDEDSTGGADTGESENPPSGGSGG